MNNASEINKIAENLISFAENIGKYRENNYENISKDENDILLTIQKSMLEYSDELCTQSAIIVSDEVQDSLKSINNLIVEINESINDLKEIQKTIDLATAIINVGTSIISQNPGAIGKSLANLVSTYKK